MVAMMVKLALPDSRDEAKMGRNGIRRGKHSWTLPLAAFRMLTLY